jgi:HlyD family secretion protein
MRTNWGIALLALVVVFSAGCVDRAKQDQAKRTQQIVSDPTTAVQVEAAKTQSLTETLQVTGEVTTSQDSQVGAKRSGRIVQVLVKDGDPVVAGQLLATMDTTDLRAQLSQALANLSSARSQLSQAENSARVAPTRSAAAVKQAEAQLRSARALLQKAQAGARQEEREQAEWQVRQAKSNLQTAEKDLERTQNLVSQGALPKARLDAAQNAYNSALAQYNSALEGQRLIERGTRSEDLAVAQESVRQAEQAILSAKAQQRLDVNLDDQVQSARAAVQSAQAQVDIARQALTDAEIRSPFAGKVAGNPVQAGTVVSPGQPIIRMIGVGGMYFEGEVPENAIAALEIGSPVSITISAVPNRNFMGTVAAIAAQAESVGRLFKVRVTLQNGLENVKPGMFAEGRVQLKTVPNATVVPVAAVVTRGGQRVVFTLTGSGSEQKAKALPVTTGLQVGDLMQVNGVEPGQQIVVQGQDTLIDGSTVTVKAAAEASGQAKGE